MEQYKRITKPQENIVEGFSEYTINKGYELDDIIFILGKIEDIFEKYHIKSISELDKILREGVING